MIVLLKVYETLYFNDQQKIIFKLIIKSKFSNIFFKSVRQAYLYDHFAPVIFGIQVVPVISPPPHLVYLRRL